MNSILQSIEQQHMKPTVPEFGSGDTVQYIGMLMARFGTYGLSIESGQPIPDERLEALPTAELTVEEERARNQR